MNAQPNTPGRRPEGNPYRVPDGYFAEMRSGLRDRIALQTSDPVLSVWQRIRGLVGFSAAFGCLVLLATVGYYFTGYKAQQDEQLAVYQQETELMLGYSIYAEDLEDLLSADDTVVDSDSLGEESNGQLFAQAVTEYLTTYGYDGVDITTLTDSDNNN